MIATRRRSVLPGGEIGRLVLMIAASFLLGGGVDCARAGDQAQAAIATPAGPKADTGDTAWVLVSAALVMLMTPGLAFFYGGLVRRKNMLSVLMQCLMILCLI